MVFIIRLRTPLGTKRLAFESPAVATLAQLQQQVADLTGVAIPEQRLSTTPLSRPTFLIGSSSDTLQKLGLTHGDMLHLESSTEVRDLEAERRVQAEADKAAKAKVGVLLLNMPLLCATWCRLLAVHFFFEILLAHHKPAARLFVPVFRRVRRLRVLLV